MHLEVLVEDHSTEEALKNLIPRILGEQISFKIHVFNGKRNLLKKLPDRLGGFAGWLPADSRIVVLVDQDQEDCKKLKERLEETAIRAHLGTRTHPRKNRVQVLNRIAVEELEAWFFGDIEAVAQAYPGVSNKLQQRARYRDPDAVKGGTWESLEKILQSAGHHKGGLQKIKAARDISIHMIPSRNRSGSFQVFFEGLLAIADS